MLTCIELSASVSCPHGLNTDFETGLMPGRPSWLAPSCSVRLEIIEGLVF